MGDPRYKVLLGACLTQFTVIGMLFSFGLFLPIIANSPNQQRN